MDKPDFDITKVGRVRQVVSSTDANSHLKLGWLLLGVFQGKDSESADPVYVLAWPDKSKHENPEGWSG